MSAGTNGWNGWNSRMRWNGLARARRLLQAVGLDLRAQPLHVALSVVALSVGVLAITLTSVSGLLAHDVFVAKEEQRTARATTYSASMQVQDWSSHGPGTALETALSPLLRPSGASAVVTASTSGSLTLPGQAPATTSFEVVWGDYATVRRLPVLHGSVPQSAYPPALSVNVASGLQVGDHVGVSLSGGSTAALTVAAVVADGATQPSYYLPGTLCYDGPLHCRPTSTTLLVHSSAPSAAVDSVLARLATSQHLTVEPVARYDSVAGVQDQLSTLQVIFLACGGAALVVGALGLVNLGLATIRSRRRELSIRRAIGATRRDILVLVLATATTTGLAGALVAVAIVEIGMTIIVPRLIDPATGITAPALPLTTVAVACATGVVTSLLGAAAPALLASKVDIAGVLRD